MNCRFTLLAYHGKRGARYNKDAMHQLVNPIWRILADCRVRTAAHG
jgi:hypothetical protein